MGYNTNGRLKHADVLWSLQVGQTSEVPATIRDVVAWKEAAYKTYLNGSSQTAVARRLLHPICEATTNEETNSQANNIDEGIGNVAESSTANAPLDPDWHHPCLGPAAFHREFVSIEKSNLILN
jgi:hypothetical protein